MPCVVSVFRGVLPVRPGDGDSGWPESILPSPAQMALWTAQSVVTGRTMVTSLLPSGLTAISQRTFRPRSGLTTSPPVSAA